jgi:hypothetical protein
MKACDWTSSHVTQEITSMHKIRGGGIKTAQKTTTIKNEGLSFAHASFSAQHSKETGRRRLTTYILHNA